MTREEAIKIINDNINLHGCGQFQDALKTLIPGFRESEDERMIKSLKRLIKAYYDVNFPTPEGFEREDMLSWLEKQNKESVVTDVLIKAGLKTYKDGNKWCILVGDNIQDGICGFGDTVEEALFEFLKEFAEKQGEQKSADKVEQKQNKLPKGEDYGIDGLWQAIQILEHSLGEVDGWQSDDGILEHKCAIEAVNRLYKQKPTWSEEDEKHLMAFDLAVNRCNGKWHCCGEKGPISEHSN